MPKTLSEKAIPLFEKETDLFEYKRVYENIRIILVKKIDEANKELNLQIENNNRLKEEK